MASVAYMASTIPSLISLEVVKALRSSLRQRSSVTMMRVKAVVDVAEKAARAVKPGASSKEHPANKPVGPIVAIRSTVIRLIVEIPVRAHGGRANVYANRNLAVRHRCTAQKDNCENCESKHVDFEHIFSLIHSELPNLQ
jgi:hypothetical protein